MDSLLLHIGLTLFGFVLFLIGVGVLYLGVREFGWKRWATEHEKYRTNTFTTVTAGIIMGIICIFVGFSGLK